MRHLVELNFPPPKSRGSKPGGLCTDNPEALEEAGQSFPRSRSSSARSRSIVTDTLDLDKLPWHVYEKGLVDSQASSNRQVLHFNSTKQV